MRSLYRLLVIALALAGCGPATETTPTSAPTALPPQMPIATPLPQDSVPVTERDQIEHLLRVLVVQSVVKQAMHDAVAGSQDKTELALALNPVLDILDRALAAEYRGETTQIAGALRRHQDDLRSIMTRWTRDESLAAQDVPGELNKIDLATTSRQIRAAMAAAGFTDADLERITTGIGAGLSEMARHLDALRN